VTRVAGGLVVDANVIRLTALGAPLKGARLPLDGKGVFSPRKSLPLNRRVSALISKELQLVWRRRSTWRIDEGLFDSFETLFYAVCWCLMEMV
jgi:hypothetical protein